MKDIDKLRDLLVDELILLSKKAKLDTYYILNMPRLERKHALDVVEKMLDEEAKAAGGKDYLKRK